MRLPNDQTLQSLNASGGKNLCLSYYSDQEIGSADVELISKHLEQHRPSSVTVRDVTIPRSDASKLLEAFGKNTELERIDFERVKVKESSTTVGIKPDEINEDLKTFFRKSSSITTFNPLIEICGCWSSSEFSEIVENLNRNNLVRDAISDITSKIFGARLALTLKGDTSLKERLDKNDFKISHCAAEIKEMNNRLKEGLAHNDFFTIASRFHSPTGQHIVRKMRVDQNVSWPSLFGQKSLRLAEFPDYEIEVATSSNDLIRMGEESKNCIRVRTPECTNNQHVMIIRNVKTDKVEATFRCSTQSEKLSHFFSSKREGPFSLKREEVAGHANLEILPQVLDLIGSLEKKIESGEIPIDFDFLEEARSERLRTPTLEERLNSEVGMNLFGSGLRRSIKELVGHCSGGEHDENPFRIGHATVSLSDPEKFRGKRFKENVLAEMFRDCSVGSFELDPLRDVPVLSPEVEERKKTKRDSIAPKSAQRITGSIASQFRDDRL
jgi:hypothetical protein